MAGRCGESLRNSYFYIKLPDKIWNSFGGLMYILRQETIAVYQVIVEAVDIR